MGVEYPSSREGESERGGNCWDRRHSRWDNGKHWSCPNHRKCWYYVHQSRRIRPSGLGSGLLGLMKLRGLRKSMRARTQCPRVWKPSSNTTCNQYHIQVAADEVVVTKAPLLAPGSVGAVPGTTQDTPTPPFRHILGGCNNNIPITPLGYVMGV